MSNQHLFRLHPRRLSFYDPINRLHLTNPFNPEGTLPLGADLSYVTPALISGDVIDVNGTAFKQGPETVQEVQIVGVTPLDVVPEKVAAATVKEDKQPEAEEVKPEATDSNEVIDEEDEASEAFDNDEVVDQDTVEAAIKEAEGSDVELVGEPQEAEVKEEKAPATKAKTAKKGK